MNPLQLFPQDWNQGVEGAVLPCGGSGVESAPKFIWMLAKFICTYSQNCGPHWTKVSPSLLGVGSRPAFALRSCPHPVPCSLIWPFLETVVGEKMCASNLSFVLHLSDSRWRKFCSQRLMGLGQTHPDKLWWSIVSLLTSTVPAWSLFVSCSVYSQVLVIKMWYFLKARVLTSMRG